MESNPISCRHRICGVVYVPPPNFRSTLWSTLDPQMGGTDPWVLAVAQAASVPEPSALVLAGSAIVCGLAYGLARKRRAQRKARNE